MSEVTFDLEKELKQFEDDQQFQYLARKLYSNLSNKRMTRAELSEIIDNITT